MGAKFTDDEVLAALRAALPAESDAIYHEGMGVFVRDQMEKLIKTFSGGDDRFAPDDVLVWTTANIASKVAGPALKDLGDEKEFYTLYLVGANLPIFLRFIQIYAGEFIQQLRGGEAIPAAAASGLASWLMINFNVNSSLAIAAGTLIILTLGRSIGKSLERHELERGLSSLASHDLTFSEEQMREALARPLPPLPRRVRIFYSYAHRDEEYRILLQHALAMLRRQGRILDWHDRKIIPGADWRSEIMQELQAAAVVLLLVSRDFIASDFCWSTEFEVAMHRHKRGECIIIPIILRPCDWQHPPLATIQVLPKDGTPITTWSNVDEAWLDVAHGIRSAIDAIAPATPSRSPSSS